MTYGESSVPSAVEAPIEVSQAAQSRGFGPLLSTRALANAGTRGVVWLVVAAACLGLLVLFANVFHPSVFSWWYSVARFIALFFCFGMVGALTIAIRTLVMGNRSYFVFGEGFVYRHNGKVQAFAWPEITGLRSVLARRGDAAGKLSHYNLQTQAGEIMIPINIVNGRDEFLDHLMAQLNRHGRPIS